MLANIAIDHTEISVPQFEDSQSPPKLNIDNSSPNGRHLVIFASYRENDSKETGYYLFSLNKDVTAVERIERIPVGTNVHGGICANNCFSLVSNKGKVFGHSNDQHDIKGNKFRDDHEDWGFVWSPGDKEVSWFNRDFGGNQVFIHPSYLLDDENLIGIHFGKGGDSFWKLNVDVEQRPTSFASNNYSRNSLMIDPDGFYSVVNTPNDAGKSILYYSSFDGANCRKVQEFGFNGNFSLHCSPTSAKDFFRLSYNCWSHSQSGTRASETRNCVLVRNKQGSSWTENAIYRLFQHVEGKQQEECRAELLQQLKSGASEYLLLPLWIGSQSTHGASCSSFFPEGLSLLLQENGYWTFFNVPPFYDDCYICPFDAVFLNDRELITMVGPNCASGPSKLTKILIQG